MTEAAREQVAKALGRIPSGCAIVTAASGRRRTGMLASWVQQAGFEPPMLSVAIKKGRPITELIEASKAMVVNVLGDNPGAMFRHFGRGFDLTEDAFEGLQNRDVNGGVEIAGHVARLSLVIRGKADAGDHDLYVGEVVEADVGEPVGEPYVHLRKNGLSY